MCLKPIALAFLVFPVVQSAQTRVLEQTLGTAEVCHTAPQKLEGGAIHILRVEVLSSGPTDGTYANDGYGMVSSIR